MSAPNQKKSGGSMGGGPMGGMPVGEKAKNFKGTVKKLLQYMGKYKIALVIVVVLAVLSTVFNIVGPKILGLVTTEIGEGIMRMVTGAENGINFVYIGKIAAVLLGLYLISSGFGYLQHSQDRARVNRGGSVRGIRLINRKNMVRQNLEGTNA